MKTVIAIPPYAEPVHLVEMKNHLKADASVTEDDALILSHIATARETIETATGANVPRHRVMLATSFQMMLDWFPSCGYIEVPRVPLVSVTSITYVDTAGDTQTLSSSVYAVNAAEGRIYLAYGQSWPSLRGAAEDRITVEFIAGMAATFTAAVSGDVLTIKGRSFAVGDRVRVVNSGGKLPTGLAANTDYFIIAGPKLSLTAGGAAVDITAVGDGAHFIGTDISAFQVLQVAVKVQATRLYRNRGDGNALSASEEAAVDRIIESAVASQHA